MITPKGVITFPVLFEAKENLSGDMKFSCTLLIPKSDKAGLKLIQADIDRAIARGKEKVWSGKVPKFRYEPLRDGDQELKEGTKEGAEYKGHMFFNCNANEDSPPGIVGRDARPLMSQSEVYSGCIVHLDVRAFPYKNGGNCGVGWWLNNVMKVDDGPRLDGKMDAVDAFAGYAQTDETEESDNLA